jgi:lipoyl(octanoyl) transferase
MVVQDLGIMAYREAWAAQELAHAAVLEGDEQRLLLVEHPPVITFGRRPDVARNMIADQEQLAKMGVEVVQSDRGGDITFHGPGQLVAYPIVRLIDHKLSVGGYVRTLEQVVIDVLADYAIPAQLDSAAVGVWTGHAGALAKICALGVRIRRGVSMHGIALNLNTDLACFNLIIPCGLRRPVTSMSQVMGERAPTMDQLKQTLVRHMLRAFA